MAESSIGETDENDTLNGFVEALWRNPGESLSSYVQLGYQSTDNDNSNNSTSYWLAGIQWLSYNGFDISAQYKHKLKDVPTIDNDPILSVQIRYRM